MAQYAERTYRLTDVLDHQGNSRTGKDQYRQAFYNSILGCVAQNIREDTYFYTGDRIARFDFVQDEEGRWINRGMRTSPLTEIRELADGGLAVVTRNSIYCFTPAELTPPVYRDDKNLIELYLTDVGYQFAAGFFYDQAGKPHPLEQSLHLSMFQDSVLIRTADDPLKSYVCRFFPWGWCVEFYDTIYRQQDYSSRMLIHNNGDFPLQISFEGFRATWTILPGEEKMILPYHTDGADEGSTAPDGNNG